jgi:hypothetical protein
VFTSFSDNLLKIDVTANTYIHELCAMPEIVALGTQIDKQIVSLLPGETHTFTISGDVDDLKRISEKASSLLWSHNRVVNP